MAAIAPLRRSMNVASIPSAVSPKRSRWQPVWMRSAPMRASAAACRMVCSAPRWMEICGHRYPAARPRGSSHIGSPRLVKYASVEGVDAIGGEIVGQSECIEFAHGVGQQVDPDTECLDAIDAFEHPDRKAGACRLRAAVRPPIPPPAMMTSFTVSPDECVDLGLGRNHGLEMLGV